MAEADFMKDILADAESTSVANSHNRTPEVKKLNLPPRYVIQTDRPLPQFSSSFARAFEVNDAKNKENIYALVLPSSIPIRFQTIQLLKTAFHQNFMNVVEAGLTDVAGGQFGNYAVILEKPKGKKLSDWMKSARNTQNKDTANREFKSILNEDFVTQEIIAPINEVLKTMAESNLSHGRINHDNVYFESLTEAHTVLGECISEPCGYSQPVHYETIERAQSMALGKGDADIKDDYFALGILLYYCLFGEIPSFGSDASELLKARIARGSYNVFIGQTELSPHMTDIFRGLLTDNPADRWGYEQVASWVKGKRFNLIRPGSRKDQVRGYEFQNHTYANKRALANAYAYKWDEAALDIREKRVGKWLDLGSSDKQMGEEILSIIAATGGDKTKSRQDNDELTAKTLVIMDLEAPLRYREMSMHLEGMGAVLANAWAHQNQQELQSLFEMIRMNLPNFKAVRLPPEADKVDRWILQRQQTYVKYKSLGFGIERVLYDLNPALPCQSPMLANQFIIDCSQLLFYLNDNASRLINNDPVDRHIAAFITSKLELAAEVKLKVMTRFNRNENAILQITKLALLAFAQKKSKIQKLPGLATWMIEKLKVVINSIHSKTLRKEFSDELKQIANQGNLEAMLSLLTSSDYFARDDEGYADARNYYAALSNDLRTIKAREKMAMGQDSYYLYGLQFSKIVAAMIFIVSLGLAVSW